MDVKGAQAELGKSLFLDVREADEWAAGHIQDSVHIPLMELPERFEELPDGQRVIAVCQVGQRSDLAARSLRDQGFDAHNLEGGVTEWQAAGLPLVTDRDGVGEIVDGYVRDFKGL